MPMTEKSKHVKSGRESERWMVLGLHAALVIACIAVYGQVRSFSFVGYDDPIYIGKTADTQIIEQGLSIEGLKWIWTADAASLWEPLNYLSHMLDVELWDNEVDDAGGHHVTNLLLHVFNASLVFSLLSRICVVGLTRESRRSQHLWIAFFSAAIFAMHPMRAESVGWISERKGLLCATFVVLALLAYLRFAATSQSRWMIVAAALTAFGMMSKPAAIVIPVLMGLLDIWPIRRCGFETSSSESAGNIGKFLTDVIFRQLREKWLVVLLAIFMAFVTIYVQFNSNTDKLIGARPLLERLFFAPAGLVYYLRRTVWPTDLTFEYPYPNQSDWYLPASLVAILILTLVVVVVRRRIPWLFFAWGWFLICWLPVSGLVYVGTSFTTDRYTYLPHIGLLFGIATHIGSYLDRQFNHERSSTKEVVFGESPAGASKRNATLPENERSNSWLGLIALSIAVTFSVLCFRQTKTWKDDLSLNSHAVAAQPNSAVGFLNLGVTLEKQGKPREAIAQLERSVGIAETYTAYFNLGRAYSQVPERAAEAIDAYQNAVKINPEYADAWHNLGLSQMRAASSPADLDPAIESVMTACNLVRGNNALYLNSLAELLMRQERYDEAQVPIARALQMPLSSPALKSALERKMRDLRAALDSPADSR